MAITYSRYELINLIAHAKALGFTDDVEHFQGLLDQMQD